jgi:hypothetical protein
MTTETPLDQETRQRDARTTGAEMTRGAEMARTERRTAERPMATGAAGMLSFVSDAFMARRVFGEPYERGGMVVIPAAKVRGGAGAGGGEQGGGGFGLFAKPAGAWVIRGDQVSWNSAIDVTRIVLGAEVVAIVALLVLRTALKASARR